MTCDKLHNFNYKIRTMPVKRIFFLLMVFSAYSAYADDTLNVLSPNHTVGVNIYHQPDGQIKYGAFYKQKYFIKPSGLAMRFATPDVTLNKFDIIKQDQKEFDETWKPVWGEYSSIQNTYEEMTLQL